MPSVQLTVTEVSRLADLEEVIDRGKQTFIEVGSALLEIRESKLYRAAHATFSAYCLKRHGFSDSRGRQLIAAAKTVTAVTDLGLPTPTTEREARAMARQLRAQADALDGGKDEQLVRERLALIAETSALIRNANAEMRKAIREAQLAIGTDPDDPEVIAEAERIIERAYALLDEEEANA